MTLGPTRTGATLSDVATATFMICAVVLTGIAATRQYSESAKRRQQVRDQTSIAVSNWSQLASSGWRTGPTSTQVTIVEFSDFECPFCGRFNRDVLPAVLRAHPNDVAILYRHWPLPIHKLSYPAARAAECAGDQGRFDQFRALVYAQQDSLGLKALSAFAVESGVKDQTAFARCNGNAKPVASIEHDIADAKAMHARGTPTIVVNGWWVRASPDSARLDSLITAELARHARR